MTPPVLEIEDLRVGVQSPAGTVWPVNGVSLKIEPGEIVGLVGESGSGKTLTTLAIGQLLPPGVRVEVAKLRFLGEDLVKLGRKRTRHLLGTKLAMVFQDPAASLNPSRRIGPQMIEAVVEHTSTPRHAVRTLAADKLAEVGIAAPSYRLRRYPHELSGGMRQRVMIAMGLMGSPALIVADEPTTALDVTVQAQVMALLTELNRSEGVAVLMVSHNIALLSQTCDRLLVMYGGRIVEEGPTAILTRSPNHPYAKALMSVVPDIETPRGTRLVTIEGAPPEPSELGPGCAFTPRCPYAFAPCATDTPPLVEVGHLHYSACWLNAPTTHQEETHPSHVTGGRRSRT